MNSLSTQANRGVNKTEYVLNPCHARPPYGRTYPLGPGILWVYPPNQKDFIDFYYWFNSVLHKLK